MPEHARDAAAGEDPFEAFTGDRAAAARLRAGLSTIAEDHAGTGVGTLASEVLAGRRPVRDLAADPDFSGLIADGVDDYRRYVASLSPEERAEMVETARATPPAG